VSADAEFNLATIASAIADAVPEREFFVHGSIRMTYAQFIDRARRCARVLHDAGLGCHTERSGLASHESGQDHLALYLHNGREFLEANVGAYAARVAPFNVNYRYVDTELVELLGGLDAAGVVFHSTFAPTLARVRDRLPALRVLLQVDDGSGHPLLPGAEWFEQALAAASPEPLPVTPSPDDLYVLCTGGTTGRPKGVLWRQADIWVAALGGSDPRSGAEFTSLTEVVAQAAGRPPSATMVIAPFMHGSGQWSALASLTHGLTVVLPTDTTRLDPADVLATCERERVTRMMVVGDAFVRPLLDELERRPYELSALRSLTNGGAGLSVAARARLRAALPGVAMADGLGSSETGTTAMAVGGDDEPGVFTPAPTARVLAADRSRLLSPGEDESGWTANLGRIPLGYYGDAAKTAATFPVVDGVRYVVPGDRARLRGDGRLELLGRDSVTINSGGEKIFAEEVEQALLHHPGVQDVVVCGRPSARWGSEVAAVVARQPGATVDVAELLAEAARHLARYKLPKVVVFRDVIERSPSGKADYRWARRQLEEVP
jgi:acyl-CoA synthetase (AMP-forming)/AMP-acid ligase II